MMNEYREVRNQENNKLDRLKFIAGAVFTALISAICVTAAFRTPVYGATIEVFIEADSGAVDSNT